MAASKKSDFLSANYDKLLFAVSLVVLLGTAGALVALSGSAREEASEFDARVKGLSPAHPDLPALSPHRFESALAATGEPYAMAGTNVSFLVAPERVACIKCGRPIALLDDDCPWCAAKQPEEIAGDDKDWDSDQDGIPDEWEKKHQLNPFEVADADLDADGDGFTNIEEFRAGTDPREPASHPPKFDFLRVDRIEVAPFPYRMTGSKRMKKDGSYAFAVTRPGARDPFWIGKGDTLEKTGFKLEDYAIVNEEVVDKTGKHRVDVVTLTLSNGADKIVLKTGKEPVSEVYEATFVCSKDAEGTSYSAKRNETFEFDGETFRLLSVDRSAGTARILRVSADETLDVPAR